MKICLKVILSEDLQKGKMFVDDRNNKSTHAHAGSAPFLFFGGSLMPLYWLLGGDSISAEPKISLKLIWKMSLNS